MADAKPCATPGCGNPAAYRTRTKPAYCAACIERIAAKGGLVLDEPVSKPNDFIMTTCTACGGRAHYRFNYILDKVEAGEAVCRRCYWRSWYRGSWELYGVGQGQREALSERGAQWFANAYGFDLLDVTPGAVPGEEIYHVRCRACGRVTYERLGDVSWGCSCSKRGAGARKAAEENYRIASEM